MPDQQEKTSTPIPTRQELGELEQLEAESRPFEKLFDPSDITKDEIYDLVNQAIHDTAHAWQLFDQGDPEEGLTVLHSIRDRFNEIEMILEDCRIAFPVPRKRNPSDAKEATLGA